MGEKIKYQTVQQGRHKARRVLSAAARYLRRLPHGTEADSAVEDAQANVQRANTALMGRVGMSQDEQAVNLRATRQHVANALTGVKQARTAVLKGEPSEDANALVEALDNIYSALMEAKKRVTGSLNTATLRNFEKHQEAKRNGEVPKFTYSERDDEDEFLVNLLETVENSPFTEPEPQYASSYGDDEDDDEDVAVDDEPVMGFDSPYLTGRKAGAEGGNTFNFTGRESATTILSHPVIADLFGAVSNLINAEADRRRNG